VELPDVAFGLSLWGQQTSWADLLSAAKRVDSLGYDHLATWDHLLAATGDPNKPVFESYATLAAWAAVTSRVRLGLLVGANSFRNPAIVAKAISTIDHISGGRAMLGLGGAWHEREHDAYGIDFGASLGERLRWLDEALSVIRPLLDGVEVTHAGPRYVTNRLQLNPPPVQSHLPITVGGKGERKTLRSVAKYADIWNAVVSPDEAARKLTILEGYCQDVGRESADITFDLNCKIVIRDSEAEAESVMREGLAFNEMTVANWTERNFWVGTPDQIATKMRPYVGLGFRSFTCELLAPFDAETMSRFISEVKPLVDQP